MDQSPVPLLVFDGACGFCTSAASWAEAGWRRPARCVPRQSLGNDGLAELGLTVTEAREAAWWVDGDGTLDRGHRAVARALLAGYGWRRVAGRLIMTPPVSFVAAGLYRVVVANRDRLPGGTPACRVG